MPDDPRQSQTTREFLALWNDTIEEHLVGQLAQSLPGLARDPTLRDPMHTADLARHLVRALRISASSGDASVGIRYLAEVAQGDHEPTA